MGCGQSKINLYPRRNKNGGKGSRSKKSGAGDKEADEEEGSAGAAPPTDDAEDDPEKGKQILPLSAHAQPVEASASQQDFFKLLEEKIDQGKDYDSNSETEVRIEHEWRRILIDQWRSTSQSTQSSFSLSSPPTPAKRRVNRPLPPDRHSPGSNRRCLRQHVPDGMSPPPRRSNSAQSHHQDPRQVNGDSGWREDPNRSPVKRPQSAGSSWKNNPKVTPYIQKPKKNEVNENQRTSNHRDYENSHSNQDLSQVTYNPTFQNNSPAHSAKSQQPFIAQIVSYPVSQQVTPPSPPKFIAPPEEYQDPQNNMQDNKYCTAPRLSPGTPNSQSNIYYIHGNANLPQDLAQQRQQTVIHLQQYVAMKQAQQQMYTYLQRQPHTVFPGVGEYTPPNRVYEQPGLDQPPAYSHVVMRPHSAPVAAPIGVVRPMQATPGASPTGGTHMPQGPMWSPMPPVVNAGPWAPGQVQEMQYYPQSNFTHMYRPNSAGSAGTLTRYHKGDDGQKCQSINLVRQKPVGQIVVGGEQLTVCTNASDSPSPASVSTDSGVSPGNSAPSSKTSVLTTPPSAGSVKEVPLLPSDTKVKKTKSTFSRPLKSSKSLDS